MHADGDRVGLGPFLTDDLSLLVVFNNTMLTKQRLLPSTEREQRSNQYHLVKIIGQRLVFKGVPSKFQISLEKLLAEGPLRALTIS